MGEIEWLQELNLYMDHNDNWTREDLARFIFLTQEKSKRSAALEYLNEGHADGPWKESTDETSTSGTSHR